MVQALEALVRILCGKLLHLECSKGSVIQPGLEGLKAQGWLLV